MWLPYLVCQTLGPIVGRFSNADNVRPEVHSDIISGVVVDPTGLKVHAKFDAFRSNRSRDIRLPHFVLTTTTTTPAYAAHHIRAKRHFVAAAEAAADIEDSIKQKQIRVSLKEPIR